MAVSCQKCGARTEIEAAFFEVRRSFSTRKRFFCPLCHRDRINTSLRRQMWSTGLVAVIGGLLILSGAGAEFGWFLLNLFFFDVFLVASIFPHEFGHAFVARWLGFRVFRVNVGSGNVLFRGDLFGFDTEVRAIPFDGLTLVAPLERKHFRWKLFLLVLAGPLANSLICLVVFLLLPPGEWFNWARFNQGLALGHMLLFSNLLILLANLWPRSILTAMGKVGTDGRQLWEAFREPEEKIQAQLVARYLLESAVCYEKGDSAGGMEWVCRGLELAPDDLLLRIQYGVLLLEKGENQSARQIFLALLTREQLEPTMRGLLLNNVAYADVCASDPALLDEADRYSLEAMDSLGWMPSIKGTRGSVLVDVGRVEEGLELLHQSMQQADTERSKAHNACWISIAESRRGNADAARTYLDEARRLDDTCVVIERAVRELSGVERANIGDE